MRKYTNKTNLPAPLALGIIAADMSYESGLPDGWPPEKYITATGLIKPPRMVELQRQHGSKISYDVADLLYSAHGTIVHLLIEKGLQEAAKISKLMDLSELGIDPDNLAQYQLETRLYKDVGDWKIGGKFDLFYKPEGGHLVDWKEMSVWGLIKGIKPDIIAQLNVLAHLNRLAGREVNHLWVGAWLRDWSKNQVDLKPDYPPKMIQMVRIPMWLDPACDQYIRERVTLHKSTREGNNLPPCSPEELWEKGPAAMRKGRKTAIKVFHPPLTREDCEQWIAEQNDKDELYVRPGEFQRCKYCDVKDFCSQYKEMQ